MYVTNDPNVVCAGRSPLLFICTYIIDLNSLLMQSNNIMRQLLPYLCWFSQLLSQPIINEEDAIMNKKISLLLGSTLLLVLGACSVDMAAEYTQPMMDIVRDQSNSLIQLFKD